MPSKKLAAIVTMMMLTGAKAGAQEFVSVDELKQIENLIGQQDCGALYSFLAANPHTTSGQDALARELQTFVRDVRSGNLECFSAPRTAQANTGRAALAASQIY